MNKENLSGVYARSFKSQYAIGVDTLKLYKITNTSYRITKASSYQRIIDGKMRKNKEYHTEYWQAIFDNQDEVLDIQPSGKVLGVDLDKKEILSGNSMYKRVVPNE